MYGKIFEQIYDGTLRADWKALVTFEQIIVLCDEDGMLDMTPLALHGRTGIPIEILEYGIEYLSKPDPMSRSKVAEGRRLVLIDETRPWGWKLVNHRYYRDLATRKEKKEADRERVAAKRKKDKKINDVADCRKVSQGVASSRKPSQSVADVAYTDTDTDTDIYTKGKKSEKLKPENLNMPPGLNLEAWILYVNYRSVRKLPKLKPMSITRQCKWLVAQGSPDIQAEIIDTAIRNNNQGLYELKGGQRETGKGFNKPRTAASALASRCKPAYN